MFLSGAKLLADRDSIVFENWYIFLVFNKSTTKNTQNVLGDTIFYETYSTALEYLDDLENIIKKQNELFRLDSIQIGNVNRTIVAIKPIYHGNNYTGCVYTTADYYNS